MAMSFRTSPRSRSVTGLKECQMTRTWNWLITRFDDERGQSTVEYFLVILAAAALAVMALRWVQSTSGGSGGGLLGELFGRVLRWVIGRF